MCETQQERQLSDCLLAGADRLANLARVMDHAGAMKARAFGVAVLMAEGRTFHRACDELGVPESRRTKTMRRIDAVMPLRWV